jgi:hypothetical protein
MIARTGLHGSHRDTRVNPWSGLSLLSCALNEWGNTESRWDTRES